MDSNLLSKGCCIKKYFTKTTATLTLEKVRNSITYVREQYTGSNWDLKCDDATVEFELFLANLSSGRFKGIELKDFMLFASGYDKIPSFGLKKKIEVFFVDDGKLPRASTCGLFMEMCVSNTQDNLAYAVEHGQGYGLL